jgi:Tol biopolymer transport system component
VCIDHGYSKVTISVGTKFGYYDVRELLGAGGMGQVWRAHDTRLGRYVALKVLHAALAKDSDRLARFRREAQVLASLNHPHIATIHGFEEERGLPVLVMELVEGPTLTQRITQGSIRLDEALNIARQIAEALDTAHGQGIVHRDLKPANIKIRADGTVKVLDFGLAKALDPGDRSFESGLPTVFHRTNMTEAGVILGTAAYMSPEQARGKSVDKRSDIWAFGCVLYEILTGRATFAGETTTDTIVAILEHQPEWNNLPGSLPGPIRRLLRRCLAKDVRRRLRDIGDALLEIEESLAGVSDLEPGEGLSAASRRDVEVQRLTDFVGMKECPVISPDGKMVAFVAMIGGRRQIWIRMLAGGASLQVTRHATDHEQPRWAADSSTLVYYRRGATATEEGAIWEVSALGGPARRLVSALGGGDISHDGRWIAVFQSVGPHVELVVFGRDGSSRKRVLSLPPEYLYGSPRWSPDDRFIAFERDSSNGFDMRIEIVAVAGVERREVARCEWLQGFSWLPDGSGLVYSSSRGSTLLYPPTFNLRAVGAGGQGDCQLTFGDVSYVEPDIRRSDQLVANRMRSQSDIWKFPIAGSPAENTRDAVRITQQTGQARTPSVSPDGREVVYLSDNGGHGNLWIAQTDGTGVRQLTFEKDPAVVIGLPMWSPAGDWVAFILSQGGQTGLWLIRPDGSGLRHAAHGWYACWSSDGRWLYYTAVHEELRYLERVPVEGGKPEVVRSSSTTGAAVSADGSMLYFVHRLRTEIFGLWGDSEIRRAHTGDETSEAMVRISALRVPVSPLLLQVFLSPDGQWLAMPLLDGATTNLWVLPTAGGPMKQLTDFGDRSILISRSVSWSADSQYLYAAVAEAETDVLLFDGLTNAVNDPRPY